MDAILARSAWRGALTCGLIVLPVRLHRATEEKRVHLREIHAPDGGPIRHRRCCSIDGKDVPTAELGRGYQLPDGRLVPVTDDDLAHLPIPTRNEAKILGFVPLSEVDPLTCGTPFYVAPDGSAAQRPYAVLQAALSRAGAAALCRLVIRRRERVAALYRHRGGALILQLLAHPDEIRDPGDFAPATPVTDREVELAEMLIRELAGVDRAELGDRYREALEQVVEAKVAGSAAIEPPPMPEPAGEDLITLLERSVRDARTRDAEDE
ncbi:Ku protein [Streptomyces noursei]|uniref:non-homologous end joining protein Ku n=1 Tax=Streptomyces noursei TaxID=1971 RepID=UPI003813090A